MLNVLGGNRVYTVPEVDNLLKQASGFKIVDKLPALLNAKTNIVYYKKGEGEIVIGYIIPGDTIDNMVDEEDALHTEPVYAPVLVPYIKHYDTANNPCWYTTDSMTISDTLSEDDVLAIWSYGKAYDQLTPAEQASLAKLRLPVKYTKVQTTRHIAIDARS